MSKYRATLTVDFDFESIYIADIYNQGRSLLYNELYKDDPGDNLVIEPLEPTEYSKTIKEEDATP